MLAKSVQPCAVLGEGLGEIADVIPERRESGRITCSLHAFDRLYYTAAEHRIAAAALGDYAGRLMYLVGPCRHHGDIGETERVAVGLAVEAAHCALRALELEDVDLNTLGGTRRI